MFYERDIYPGFGGMSTHRKTLMEDEKRGGMHAPGAVTKPVNIWVALGLMLAVVVTLGVFGGRG
ncbi:MAG TPA: hypothetical protein VLH15_04305 [Dehalococcoidales bacterium]|nr:hypothetical protein [Dehalococcoidales bacterium]